MCAHTSYKNIPAAMPLPLFTLLNDNVPCQWPVVPYYHININSTISCWNQKNTGAAGLRARGKLLICKSAFDL